MFVLRTVKNLSHQSVKTVLPAAFHTTPSVKYTQLTEQDGVREICFNEPKSLNSLSLNMMESLQQHLEQNKDDTSLRCITLTGNGPVWSAGHNLKDLKNASTEEQAAIFSKLSEIIYCIRKLPVPVVAKINGVVAAGGLQLMASCDLVVCSDSSKFVLPAAKFGIFPHTPIVAITRAMPRLQAALLPFTGNPLTAKEAYVAGLVSKTTTAENLDAEVQHIVDAIKAKSRSVIALGKDFFYEQLDMPLEAAYEAAVKKMTDNIAMPDGQEGVNSFLEKRPPKWTHK